MMRGFSPGAGSGRGKDRFISVTVRQLLSVILQDRWIILWQFEQSTVYLLPP